MKRTCFTSLFLALLFAMLLVSPARAEGRSNTEQERVVRETYRKLETYNAAAQTFQNEMTRRPIRAVSNPAACASSKSLPVLRSCSGLSLCLGSGRGSTGSS